MKSVQFFVNIFASSVAVVFGLRAFANLIETEKPYNADVFFTGTLIFWGIAATLAIFFLARAWYETEDHFIKRWATQVMLGILTSTVALVVVMSWMLGIAEGTVVSVIAFGAYAVIFRTARESIADYTAGKELYFVPPIVFTAIGTVGVSTFIDDHPVVALLSMTVLMIFASATTLWFQAGWIAVPKEAVGIKVTMSPPIRARERDADAPGQLYDERV